MSQQTVEINEDERKYTIKIAVEIGKRKVNGLAIVTGMVEEEGSPAGTDKDIYNMAAAFESLDFAVVKIPDISQPDLVAVVKAAAKYPYSDEVPSCKVIAFYFAGHGDSTKPDGKPFAIVKGLNKVFVEEIVSPFYPKNARQLQNIKRLFFFDMCVGDEIHAGVKLDDRSPQNESELPLAVPAKGNCLVAFGNFIGYKCRGTAEDGGFWTRNLHKYITEDLDIFLVLAKTYEDTVRDTSKDIPNTEKNVQGPYLTACMGCLTLAQLGEGVRSKPSPHPHPVPSGLSKDRTREVQHDSGETSTSSPSIIAAQPIQVPDTVLDDNSLVKLLGFLDKFNNWRGLGLNLGLRNPTLDNIRDTHSDNGDRKREMLVAWLKWNDNVSTPEYGKPSWARLQNALKGLDDARASSMETEAPWKTKN